MGNPTNTANPPWVTFEEVSHRYLRMEGPVLENINLRVDEGDFIGLIGPSGCGKSTMLKLLSGLARPTSGRIDIHGMRADEVRREQAFVFQDATLLPWLTVKKNVELPLKLRKTAPDKRAMKARELLDLVGLAKAANSYPRQLSGGMKMRASIARALSLSPKLMLLDEPFGALDAMTRDQLNEELLEIRKDKNWTAFFVTHSVTEAVFLSNRIVIFSTNPGRVHKIVPVSFDYPRDHTLRSSIEFLSVVRAVSEELRKARE
mgnify:CR=1 FL=1